MAADDDEFPGDATEAEPAAKPAAKGGQAAAPVEPAAQPAAPEPKKHTHSALLLKKAKELGASDDWLDNTPSAEVWEEIERFTAAERAAAKPGPAAKPEPKAEEKKPAAPADEDEEYLAQLAEVDPKLAKLIRKATAARDDKVLADLRAEIDGFKKEKAERQVAAVHRALDDGFAALPPEYAEFFGEGSIHDLADEKQKRRRHAVVQAMGYKDGDGKAAIRKKIADAAELLAGHLVTSAPADPYGLNGAAKPAKKPAAAKDPETGRFTAADFNGGHVHRPNGKRGGTEELSDAETARRIRQEHGAAPGRRQFDDDDLDDLPE